MGTNPPRKWSSRQREMLGPIACKWECCGMEATGFGGHGCQMCSGFRPDALCTCNVVNVMISMRVQCEG